MFVLVSKVHVEGFNDEDVISRQDHEQETEKLELEIQHCKEMIKTQQQLLQVNETYLSKLFPWKGQSFILLLDFYPVFDTSIQHFSNLN